MSFQVGDSGCSKVGFWVVPEAGSSGCMDARPVKIAQ